MEATTALIQPGRILAVFEAGADVCGAAAVNSGAAGHVEEALCQGAACRAARAAGRDPQSVCLCSQQQLQQLLESETAPPPPPAPTPLPSTTGTITNSDEAAYTSYNKNGTPIC